MDRTAALAYAATLPGWYSRPQLAALAKSAAAVVRPGGLIVEVGTWLGRSAVPLAAVCRAAGASLVCIDTWAGVGPDHPYASAYQASHYAGHPDVIAATCARHLAPFGGTVRLWRGDSRVMHAELLDGSADLVHLDGDHCDPVFSLDLAHYAPKVRPGGILCGDDWGEDDIPAAVWRRYPGQVQVLAGEKFWMVPIPEAVHAA